jgi:hypothetical protein
MGRFLAFIGLIMMLVGFVGPMFSLGNIFSGLQPTIDLAVDADAREAELCEEGETLEEEHGASTYTMGTGYGRTITSYCVDEDGNRREVTGDLIESMIGGDFFGNISNSIGQSLIFVGLGVLGTFLMVIGMIMSIGGKRKGLIAMNPYNASLTPMQPMNPNNFGSSTPMSGSGFASSMPSNAPQNLASQLQQLEQAYNQSLITREEYEKARQNLLNNMK